MTSFPQLLLATMQQRRACETPAYAQHVGHLQSDQCPVRLLPATTCRSRRAPNSLQTGHWSARHRSLEQPLAEFRWVSTAGRGEVLPGANLWLAGEFTYVAASSGVSPNVKPVSSRVAVGAEIARWNSAVSVARGRRNRVIDRPTRQARKPRGLARLIGDLGRVADQV